MEPRHLKAQFWSFDVIFAVVIFTTAVTILAFTWFNINNQLSIGYGNGATIMQIQAKSFAQTILTPGYPTNWQSYIDTSNSMTWGGISIGIGASQGTSNLSTSKIYALASMVNSNYQATKQYLGIAFDYYITIKSNSNLGAGMNISMGKDPSANKALTVYVERRSAFVNGIPASITILVWTNTALSTS